MLKFNELQKLITSNEHNIITLSQHYYSFYYCYCYKYHFLQCSKCYL